VSSTPDGSKEFGGYASAYAARRPSYPAIVFDTLMSALDGPRRSAVELGAGSGQATRAFAERFDFVTAVEPDARMLSEFPGIANVRVVNVSAEEADFAAGSIDAVVAATSFHWMDQPSVTANAHRWLREGGVFFPFLYNAFAIDGPAQEAYDRHAGLWAPFKDPRLVENVDYARMVKGVGAFARVDEFKNEIVADMPPAGAALLLGTASFVNAYARANGIDIADYVRRLTEDFSSFGDIVRLRAPVTGALAIKG
jgi:SAM-dependent methyltransferase